MKKNFVTMSINIKEFKHIEVEHIFFHRAFRRIIH